MIQKLAIGILILSLLAALILGCTATDPITDDIYIEGDLYVWDGSAWVALGGGADVGGLYGINAETLAGDKTLTPDTDEIYQYLDPDGTNRIITLDTASATAGDRFVIKQTGSHSDAQTLSIKQGAFTAHTLYSQNVVEIIYDGTKWFGVSPGSGHYAESNSKQNIGIGDEARADNYGVAIGYSADAYYQGVAIGRTALGQIRSAAVGYGTYAPQDGVAIGYYAYTGSNPYSTAIGYRSKTTRYGEFARNIGSQTDQENNITQGGWEGQTADATPLEIFCAGVAGYRFTIRASSVLAFSLKVVARDNVANEVAMYTVSDGLIKRDAAGNTILVSGTVVTVHEDDATWAVAVTADDTNEALIITVTGDGTNPVQWAAVLDGVETHF